MKRALTSVGLLLGCFLCFLALSCEEKAPTDSQLQDQWIQANTGLDNLFIQILAVHPVDSDIVLAGTFDGLYKSTNGAQTWARLDSEWAATQVTAIVFNPRNVDPIYVGTAGAGVLKSENGGESWVEKNEGLDDLTIFSLVIDPGHPDTLYAVTDKDIYQSYNGAASWSKLHFASRTILAIDPLDSQRIYLFGSVFLKSEDGGETWSQISFALAAGSNVQCVLIDPISPNTLYTGISPFGIYKSADAALSWTWANEGLGNKNVRVIALDFSNTDLIYAATAGGVYRSNNAARDWQEMNEGLAILDVRALSVDPLRSGILYAGTWGDGVFVWTVP